MDGGCGPALPLPAVCTCTYKGCGQVWSVPLDIRTMSQMAPCNDAMIYYIIIRTKNLAKEHNWCLLCLEKYYNTVFIYFQQ